MTFASYMAKSVIDVIICTVTYDREFSIVKSGGLKYMDFYAPGTNDRGHIVFVLSVCLSVCLFVCLSVCFSVCLLSTLTFAKTFEP